MASGTTANPPVALKFASQASELSERIHHLYSDRELYYKRQLQTRIQPSRTQTTSTVTTQHPTLSSSSEEDEAHLPSFEDIPTLLPLFAKLDKRALVEKKEQYLEEQVSAIVQYLEQLVQPPAKKKKKRKPHEPDLSASATSSPSDTSFNTLGDLQAEPQTIPQSDLQLLSDHLFESNLSPDERALYYYLRGHLYNVLPTYSRLSEDYLTKSVKLGPSSVEAWNSLGEAFWKKGDLIAAKNCFEGGSTYAENKESLRKLSMVLRQLGSNEAERRKYLEESLQLCEKALKLDETDGLSWLLLGNAYLKRFYNITHNMDDIERALNAYNKAEFDQNMRNNADVYYNRAMVNQYLENFRSALEDFVRSTYLDPNEFPEQTILDILEYAHKMSGLIDRRANLKPKRLLREASQISESAPRGVDPRLKKARLRDLRSPNDSIIASPTANLSSHIAFNPNNYLCCKILVEIHPQVWVRRSFVATDADGSVFGLTIYNLGGEESKDFFKPMDLLTIVHPQVVRVNACVGKVQARYTSIRVENPMSLYVNGSPVSKHYIAAVWMSTTNRAD